MKMPLLSVEDGESGVGHWPLMNGAIAYSPLIRPSSPSRFSISPVARVRFPPPLSPATITRPGSTPSRAALAMTHFRPETQSFSPAGKGATSGTEDGTTALQVHHDD